jgi:hypothetical protein
MHDKPFVMRFFSCAHVKGRTATFFMAEAVFPCAIYHTHSGHLRHVFFPGHAKKTLTIKPRKEKKLSHIF